MRRVVPGLLTVGVIVAVVVGLLLAAGSGVPSTGVVAVGEAPRGIARRSGQGIYLVDAGRVRLVVRPGPRVDAARAVRTLLAGPTAAERAHRLTTRLPEVGGGAVRLGRTRWGAVRVRLPGRPGRLSSLAVRQLACTVGRARLAAGTPVVARAAPSPSVRPASPVAGQRSPEGDAGRVLIVDAGFRRIGAGGCPELLPKVPAVPRPLPSVEPAAPASSPPTAARPAVVPTRPRAAEPPRPAPRATPATVPAAPR